MPFSKSLAGVLSSAMKANPYATGAAVFGAGAATYAGISTAIGTEGSLGHRADAGAESGMGYGMAGMAIAGTGLTLASYPGITRPTGAVAGRMSRSIGAQAGNYGRNLSAELRTAGGWKRAMTRMPVVAAGGAGIGALIGAKLNHDDPGHGARIGAVTGAVGGVVASRVARAVPRWNKFNGLGKFGFLAAAAVAVGTAASAATPTQYQSDDAPPSGVRNRMDMIGATGDVVFGLHNRR